jgi:hypothetical protein
MVVILALKFAALGRAKVDAMGRAGRGRQGRNIPTPAISFQPKPRMAQSIPGWVTAARRQFLLPLRENVDARGAAG